MHRTLIANQLILAAGDASASVTTAKELAAQNKYHAEGVVAYDSSLRSPSRRPGRARAASTTALRPGMVNYSHRPGQPGRIGKGGGLRDHPPAPC
jgi:hypothetical protein